MENVILISWLNDFLFCPASIYFHLLYSNTEKMLYQGKAQIEGTAAHKTIDSGAYESAGNIITAMDVYSEEYGVSGKIDIFYVAEGRLVERKKHVNLVYKGYIMQLYAQAFALREMGYGVSNLQIRSLDDNKVYDVPLPEDDEKMTCEFTRLLKNIRSFSLDGFSQENAEKCGHCIYAPACDRSISDA